MRLRTLTRTATKTRASRSHDGSQRDRAFLGENLLKRPFPQCRVYDFLRFTTTLVCFLLRIPFRSAFHVTIELTTSNTDGSDLTAPAHACGRRA
jgi:hypothetical protein